MFMRYIVDTNFLLQNPQVIEQYDVIIPSHVLREIENLERTRRNDNVLQYEIREAKRWLKKQENLYIDVNDYIFSQFIDGLDPNYTDNILLQIAREYGYGIVTNDILLQEKCKAYNVPFIDTITSDFEDYKGFKEVYMTQDELQEYYQQLDNRFDLMVNEYLVVYDANDKEKVLDLMKWNGEYVVGLKRNKKGELDLSFKTHQFGDFKPKDVYQMMAVDSILSNQLTSIRGRAGSGKSKIALETAWHLIERGGSNGYEKLVIFANPTPLRDSQELGFYKGDRLEKLLQSNVGAMLASKFGDMFAIEALISKGILEILPFVDLRGYDTGEKKTIVWIIEAQNLTADLLKLGLQRISENAKVIVDGDYTAQVDKDVYALNNGMKRMSEVFRGKDLYGEIELQNIYRSKLAEIADGM